MLQAIQETWDGFLSKSWLVSSHEKANETRH